MSPSFAPLEEGARVRCPWCGEAVDIVVDPGGGTHQQYVEDCQVCCRPWRVTVRIGPDGVPAVEAEPLGG